MSPDAGDLASRISDAANQDAGISLVAIPSASAQSRIESSPLDDRKVAKATSGRKVGWSKCGAGRKLVWSGCRSLCRTGHAQSGRLYKNSNNNGLFSLTLNL